MGYRLTLERFQGPIELLVELIQQQTLDVYQISISQIADGFLSYLEHLAEADLNEISSFALYASLLMELKSRSLLPLENQVDQEEEEPLSPEELFLRMVEYRKFRKAVRYLEQHAEQEKCFGRQAELEERFVKIRPDFLASVRKEDLALILLSLEGRRVRETLPMIYLTPLFKNMEEEIFRIKEELKERLNLSFRELTQGYSDKMDIIVTFLAILELYKRGDILIDQIGTFGDIIISRAEQLSLPA
ncbi:segregation and condensation protein A [Candidatus Hakubella thermalkaliphila]|uniref:Segregation and condensation protein A n=1 Tax=Candidatus Hakubella thermalkaliphila TaxID=2754717 RepID=A0A6V8NM41_9ACTN|nr:ScpA family protein [Candidatus Hakubella thermalkaliphila]GFP21173.1 segregation and condensation protein A [Candidatus Hakubella thermalkaliphila]